MNDDEELSRWLEDLWEEQPLERVRDNFRGPTSATVIYDEILDVFNARPVPKDHIIVEML